MITKLDKQAIRQLLSDPRWQTIEALANELCILARESIRITDNEWETIQSLLLAEGEVRGIRRLMQEIYNQAKQNE